MVNGIASANSTPYAGQPQHVKGAHRHEGNGGVEGAHHHKHRHQEAASGTQPAAPNPSGIGQNLDVKA